MNNVKTIKLNDLAPKTVFCIRGRLTYSRLAKHIEGADLENDKARRRLSGRRPIEKPYTTATICDAKVMFNNPAAEQDPSLRTQNEQYAIENMYTSTSANNTGWCFTAVNKSRNLPAIFELCRETNTYKRIELAGELDSGLDVTLVMRVFRSKEQANNGISLDQVLINEPVRYYSSSIDLRSYGIITEDNLPVKNEPIGANTVAQPAANYAEPVAQTTGGGFTVEQTQNNAYGNGQFATNTPQTNVQPGNYTNPQQPSQPQQQYQAPMPASMQQQTAPPSQTNDSAFGAYPPQQNSQQQNANNPQTNGITYDPATDPNRRY